MLMCPYISVHPDELNKVKPEYRDSVSLDAGKCIKSECPSWSEDEYKCTKLEGNAVSVGIGNSNFRHTYQPPEYYLK